MTKKLSEKEITLQTYNKSAKELAEYFNSIGSRKSDINRAFSYINKKEPKVLEIGCGDGRDAEYIINKTKNYEGFDLSEEMINTVKTKVSKGNFHVADLEEYFFKNKPNKKYDIIFAFASLLHSNKQTLKKVILRVSDFITKGGIFYISLKIKKVYTRETKKDRFGTRVFYYYTPELIQNFAQNRYKTLFMETQIIGKTEWLTIILQKTKN